MNSLYGLAGAGNRLTGLASGMDIDTMVYNMTAASRSKIDAQYQAKQKLLWKQEDYRKTISSITSMRNSFMNVGKPETNMLAVGFYNSRKVGVTGTSLSATAGSNAMKGNVKVDVKNLATAQKISGTNNASFGIISELDARKLFAVNDTEKAIELDFEVMLDGQKKNVKFKLDDSLTYADDVDKIFANLEKNFQAALDKTFSNDPTKPRIGVKITGDGRMEIAASGNSKVTVGGATGEGLKANEILGLKAGTSNRLNTSKKLSETMFRTALTGSEFKFKINDVNFTFNKDSSIQDVMNAVNGSNAGVRMEYSQTTDKFTIIAKETGSGDSIKVEQSSGNLLTSMFGIAPGSKVTSGSINTTKEQAMNYIDISNIKKLAGKSFNMTVNGVTKTITLPPYSDTTKRMYDQFEGKDDDVGKWNQSEELVKEINKQLDDKFGINKIKFEATGGDFDMITIAATDRSTTFQVDGTKGDASLVNALGFYSGQENTPMHTNTNLASLGIKEGTFDIRATLFKDGKYHEINKTITIDADTTLGSLMGEDLGNGLTGADVFALDSATGNLTVETDRFTDFKISDGTSNFTENLFGASTLEGNKSLDKNTFSSSVKGADGLNTTLKDLGMASNFLNVEGSFMVNGVRINVDSTLTLNENSTIADLLAMELGSHAGEKALVSDILSYDEDTGEWQLNANAAADLKLSDENPDGFLKTIFQKDSVAGTAKIVDGVVTQKVNTVGNTSTTTAGQNAVIEIDGETIERNSNTITYEGINMTLATTGESTINISSDTTKIFDTIKKFVEEYNKLVDETNGKLNQKVNRDYKPLTPDQMAEMSESEINRWDSAAKSGVVRNDHMISKLLSDLRSTMYERPSGSQFSLYDLGIVTSDYLGGGKLEIPDEAVLKTRIEANADELGSLFSNYDGDGLMQKIDKIFDDAARTTGFQKGYLVEESGIADSSSDTLNVMSKSIKKIDDTIKELQKKYKTDTDSAYQRFSYLETYMNNMNQQSSWLSQQFQTS